MPAAAARERGFGEHHVHHVGGEQGIGGGTAEMNGDDFGQVPDDALGEEESQGQFFFQAREAHEHLEGLTPQPDFQGLLHHHPVRGLLNVTLPVTPDGEFAKGFSHRSTYGFTLFSG